MPLFARSRDLQQLISYTANSALENLPGSTPSFLPHSQSLAYICLLWHLGHDSSLLRNAVCSLHTLQANLLCTHQRQCHSLPKSHSLSETPDGSLLPMGKASASPARPSTTQTHPRWPPCLHPTDCRGPLSTPRVYLAYFYCHDSAHIIVQSQILSPLPNPLMFPSASKALLRSDLLWGVFPNPLIRLHRLFTWLPILWYHSASSCWDHYQKNQLALPSKCFQNLDISHHLQCCTSCKAPHLLLGFLHLSPNCSFRFHSGLLPTRSVSYRVMFFLFFFK